MSSGDELGPAKRALAQKWVNGSSSAERMRGRWLMALYDRIDVLEAAADKTWPDWNTGTPCGVWHPDTKEWERDGRNYELRCGRPEGHTEQHVVALPDPCPECEARCEHNPECPISDRTDESHWQKWTTS